MRALVRRLSCAVLVASTVDLPASPWDDIRGGLFNEAQTAFVAEAGSASAESRRGLRFGEAVALLNVQPRTQSNIDKAYEILEEVRSSAANDDLGIESRYLQGRIEQVQRNTPDLAKAEAIFAELVEAHPKHVIGQRAFVKLALLRLYSRLDADERRRRYDQFTARAGDITDTSAKVQLHLLLADVARRLGYGNDQELAHMLAADRTGVAKRSLQVQVLVRIGDLARLTGDKAMARTYYTRFLEEFPRTDRRSTIESYLAALN